MQQRYEKNTIRHHLRWFRTLLVVFCLAYSPIQAQASDLIYVVVEGTNELVRIDGNSGVVNKVVKVGKGPCDVAFDPHFRTLAVSHVDSWGDILLLDRDTLEVLSKVRLEGDGKSHTNCLNLAFNKDGRKLYAVNKFTGRLYVVDVRTMRMIKRFNLNKKKEIRTFKPVLSPGGGRLYIPGIATGDIYVLDTTTDVLKKTIQLEGGGIGAISISPNGKHLYVGDGLNNSLDVVDVKTHKRVQRIPVGIGPGDVVVSPDGRFAYTCNTGSQSVTVVDLKSGEPVENIDIGFLALNIKLSPDGKHLYISNWGEGQLFIIDTAKAREVMRVPNLGYGPLGIEVYQLP